MSDRVGRSDQRRVPGGESGLEGLRQSSGFRGPFEPSDDHDHSNDHFALIYESREEQFASAIPFIRQGLDRGERCLYIADDNSRQDVIEAMRDHGIDVDTALESGALSIHTPADTYRRTGEFDRTAMLEFWEESLEQAKADGGHAGLRATAEMTWALDADTSTDDLIEYEAVLNSLYRDEDYVVMCQYDRERFPATVIHDVIKTHPHVVADRTVSRNFYYTPPETFFGSEEMETKVDRMTRTLQERTEVKAELEERREYLERIFESSHDAIFIVDPESNEIVDANPAATRMLGYSRDELLTLGPSDVHPDELDTFREFVREVLEEGTGWTGELSCRTKQGNDIPAEISTSRMERNGRPVMLAVVRDVSERRKWERALRRLYEITSDPDRTFDEKLQAILELGCEHFGLDLGGLAKVDPEADLFEVEVVSDDHDHLVPGAWADLSETYCRVATDARSEDARADPVTVTDPIGDGFEGKLCYEQFGVRAYLGSHLEFEDAPDRTFWFVSNTVRDEAFSESERTFHRLMGQWVKYELERRNREQKLRERTEYLRALIETAPECIKTVAPDGTLLQMNPAGLDMVGADSASSVVGRCVYDLIAPEHRETFRAFNERICEGERETLEFDIVGLEGTRRHMETHAAPLRRPDGTISQVALTRDITGRKRRERRLEEVIERLEESNERLEQFAYAASHDLQEPLRMVSSYLQLIERRYADALDADGEEFLAFAVDGADRMREMIDGLLQYSRVESRGDPFEPVDLGVAVRDVRDDLQVMIEESDAEITVEELPRVQGDAGQLRQVFQNLLDNAIEYSGDEPPRIRVSAERDDEVWVVSVRDQGIGIDPGDANRVFEVFQRLHTIDEHSGTGIGLALCERIVERHGGEVWVESTPGEGATFRFTIPDSVDQ